MALASRTSPVLAREGVGLQSTRLAQFIALLRAGGEEKRSSSQHLGQSDGLLDDLFLGS